MSSDLTGLKIGDRIYTQKYGRGILIVTITGETTTAWVVGKDTDHQRKVRKKDGYLIGSDSNDRFSSRCYYYPVTEKVQAEYNMAVLLRKIEGLAEENIQVTDKSYDEIKAAVEVILKHSAQDK